MLAIMNIGKYTMSGVTPSGMDIFNVLNDSAFSANVKMFCSNGSRIVGLIANSIIYSDDNGATWNTSLLDYTCGYITYINDSFYALEEQATPLHYGVSSDGVNWTWNILPANSEIDSVSACHKIGIDNAGLYITYVGQKSVAEQSTTHLYYSYWIYRPIGGETTQIGNRYYLMNYSSLAWKKNDNVITLSGFKTGVSGGYDVIQFSLDGVVHEYGNSTTAPHAYSTWLSNMTCGRYSIGEGSTAVNTSEYRKLSYSDDGFNFQEEQSEQQYAGGMKPYGFFKVGNTFYVAYQYLATNNAYWVKAGSLLDALNIENLTKVSDIGLPYAFYIINSKKIIIATNTAHVFTCEVA